MAPLFGSAVGTAVLATFPEERIKRLWQRAKRLPEAVSKRLTFASQAAGIARAREQGFAAAYNQLVPDSGTVAMLVPTSAGADSNVVVCVSGLATRVHRKERRIVKQMLRVIRDISGLAP